MDTDGTSSSPLPSSAKACASLEVCNSQEESIALRTIVGDTRDFFDETWQKQCRLYRCSTDVVPHQQKVPPSDAWNDDKVKENPFLELVTNGWFAMVQMLEQARHRYLATSEEQDDPSTMLPLVFSQQQPIPVSQVQSTYNNNLFSAYLDGCSIVVNHADWTCPYLASLCIDLQKSLPHAYANAYLTPPSAQAVRPHADDRDVLVIQLVGRKHWKVYQNIPIPFPYPHQQVGKDGLEVPPSVLQGPCVVDAVLNPGDVLYMPRGYVHEAQTDESQLSYHATIALATHDWTLCTMLPMAMQHSLESIIDYRTAVPVSFGMKQNYQDISSAEINALQKQVHDALDLVKEQVTARAIHEHLQEKYKRHNQRALSKRRMIIHKARFPSTSNNTTTKAVVGPEAARNVRLQSVLRAATPAEKAFIQNSNGQQQVGLHVRPETADAIMMFVSKLKQQSEATTCRVDDLPSLLDTNTGRDLLCSLTLLSFAKSTVELGALAIVTDEE